jgi:hypothetical protein
MQKLIENQFFCYPKNKDLCILYTDKEFLKSRLFKALSLQISPKEGFLLRLRKTQLGHLLSTFKKNETLKLKVPEKNNLKIGYKNKDKIIFFEFDENDAPIKILKKNEFEIFEEFEFLGYSILENYTKKEYFNKSGFIKQALEKRWQEITESKVLHGDFTHFNVLFSQEKVFHFIDAKKIENSILFDHFYFYSYFMQCLERCQTISNEEVLEIKADLQNIIFKICKLDTIKAALAAIKIDDAIGIITSERENKFIEFSNFLLRNEK